MYFAYSPDFEFKGKSDELFFLHKSYDQKINYKSH